jgi:hypothetical protein
MTKVFVVVVAACAAALAAPSAFGYGNGALYQATESLNCNNPAFPICAPPPKGFGLGGTWQWWEFDAGFTGDATVTFCGHTQDGGGSVGAQHANLDVENWGVGPAQPGDVDFPGGVNFYANLAEWTITGRADGSPPVSFEAPFGDTGIPVVPGHYAFHPAPGVAGEVTVVAIPQ